MQQFAFCQGHDRVSTKSMCDFREFGNSSIDECQLWFIKWNQQVQFKVIVVQRIKEVKFVPIKCSINEKFIRSHQSRSSDVNISSKCSLCSGEHSNNNCLSFLELSVHDRFQQVKDLKLCFNCLRPNHGANECRVSHRCEVCNKRHHSSLHFNERPEPASGNQHFESTSSINGLVVNDSSVNGLSSTSSSQSASVLNQQVNNSTSCQSSIGSSRQVDHSSESSNVSQVFLSTAVVINYTCNDNNQSVFVNSTVLHNLDESVYSL